jgi:Tfp pilus assembly protein PilO
MEVAMKTDNRRKLLIGLVITMAGLYLGDLLILEPLLNWWSARGKEIAELRVQVKNGKALIGREAGLRSQWAQMRDHTLPDNSAVAEHQLIGAITGWSRDSGVEITGILPQWKNDTDDYQTLNCRVEVAGTLSTLSRFLYNVEKGPMGLKLDAMELSARDTAGQQLTLGLQISGLALVNPKP